MGDFGPEFANVATPGTLPTAASAGGENSAALLDMLAMAMSHAFVSGVTFYFPPGVYPVNGARLFAAVNMPHMAPPPGAAVSPSGTGTVLTFPPNAALRFANCAYLQFVGTANNEITLVIQGAIDAGLWQCFDTSAGGATIQLATKQIAAVLPEWWGAVNLASVDSAPAIQAAFDAAFNNTPTGSDAPQPIPVHLSTTYYVSETLTIVSPPGGTLTAVIRGVQGYASAGVGRPVRARSIHRPVASCVRSSVTTLLGRGVLALTVALQLACSTGSHAVTDAAATEPTANDVVVHDTMMTDAAAMRDGGGEATTGMDVVLLSDAAEDLLGDSGLTDTSLDAPPDSTMDVPVADALSDGAVGDAGPVVLPPRLLAPLSGGRTSNRRPMLRWVPPESAVQFRVDLCSDRACTMPLSTVMTTATQVQPPTTLPAGVVFWNVAALDSTGAPTWTSATWEFVAPRRDAPVDAAWGVLKDFNGDGYADVAYGDNSNEALGVAYAFVGSPGALGPLRWTENNPDALNGVDFAQALAGAGDVNGDGFGDLVVGDPEDFPAGQGYLFFGSTAFLPSTPSQIFDPIAAPELTGFAFSTAALGDINGDGFGDFAYGENGQECAYLELGAADGTTTQVQVRGVGFSVMSLREGFGNSIAGAGDLDGDGYADLVVGAPAYECGTGIAYVYFGGPSGVDSVADLVLQIPPGAYGAFGSAVQGVGDLNGDHLSDLAIGSQGSVAVYYGRADRHLGTPDVLLVSPDAGAGLFGEAFGDTLGAPGDLNGDGYADLIVGAGADGAADGAGRVYVYWGGPLGITTMPEELHGRSAPNFGVSVACAGDVDGDGYDDLVADSLELDTSRGYLEYFPGGPTGVPISPTDERGPYFSEDDGPVASWGSHNGPRRLLALQPSGVRSMFPLDETSPVGSLHVHLMGGV